ncbi:MAG: hypothetical protein EAZ12_00555 [Sphingobacteriia bacterium]|nr:MAG: hypothetical protein EAZ12_00555 [Sphingobacteriia bacterium]
MSLRQHISALRSMIPGNIKLKPSERRSMFKLNTKKKEFVQKAVQFMRRSPNTVPSYVDVSVCNNYLHLYDQYSELLSEVEEIRSKLEDAKLLIGNEVLQQSRAYFQNAKTAANSGISEFVTIYNELHPHYAVGRNSKKAEIELA